MQKKLLLVRYARSINLKTEGVMFSRRSQSFARFSNEDMFRHLSTSPRSCKEFKDVESFDWKYFLKPLAVKKFCEKENALVQQPNFGESKPEKCLYHVISRALINQKVETENSKIKKVEKLKRKISMKLKPDELLASPGKVRKLDKSQSVDVPSQNVAKSDLQRSVTDPVLLKTENNLNESSGSNLLDLDVDPDNSETSSQYASTLSLADSGYDEVDAKMFSPARPVRYPQMFVSPLRVRKSLLKKDEIKVDSDSDEENSLLSLPKVNSDRGVKNPVPRNLGPVFLKPKSEHLAKEFVASRKMTLEKSEFPVEKEENGIVPIFVRPKSENIAKEPVASGKTRSEKSEIPVENEGDYALLGKTDVSHEVTQKPKLVTSDTVIVKSENNGLHLKEKSFKLKEPDPKKFLNKLGKESKIKSVTFDPEFDLSKRDEIRVPAKDAGASEKPFVKSEPLSAQEQVFVDLNENKSIIKVKQVFDDDSIPVEKETPNVKDSVPVEKESPNLKDEAGLEEFLNVEEMYGKYTAIKNIRPDLQNSASRWTIPVLQRYLKKQYIDLVEPMVQDDLCSLTKKECAHLKKQMIDQSILMFSADRHFKKEYPLFSEFHNWHIQEADIRLFLNVLLRRLCLKLHIQMKVEDRIKGDGLPNAVCDYAFYKKNVCIGLLEAKSPSCLEPRAIPQFLVELLNVQARYGSADLSFFGILSDAHRFVLIRLKGIRFSFEQTDMMQIYIHEVTTWKDLFACGNVILRNFSEHIEVLKSSIQVLPQDDSYSSESSDDSDVVVLN